MTTLNIPEKEVRSNGVIKYSEIYRKSTLRALFGNAGNIYKCGFNSLEMAHTNLFLLYSKNISTSDLILKLQRTCFLKISSSICYSYSGRRTPHV